MSKEILLLGEIKNCVETIGIDDTINALQFAMLNEKVSFTIGIICSNLSVSLEQLKNPNLRSDVKKVAIGFCVYFLNRHLGHKMISLPAKLPFDVSERTLITYRCIIEGAKLTNPKNEIDRIVATHFKPLEQIFINYKQNQPCQTLNQPPNRQLSHQ